MLKNTIITIGMLIVSASGLFTQKDDLINHLLMPCPDCRCDN